MVAVSAPIRMTPLGLSDFPGSLLRAHEGAEVEAFVGEAEHICATIESRRASLAASARKALADARFLKKLGVSADLAEPIANLSAALPDLSDGVAAMARAVARFRASSQHRVGPGADALLEGTVLIEAELIGLRDDAAAILRELLAEQAALPAPPDDAPLNRAFEAYGAALGDILPSGAIERCDPDVVQIAGEIVPTLRVQLRCSIPPEQLILLEQDAHARVAALDPSCVGLFAIDYVRPSSAS